MWSSIAIAVGFVLFSFLVAAVPAAWMRRQHRDDHVSETRDLARDVANRVGVLHGLILGLVFGHVVTQFGDLRTGMRAEAAAVEHIYYLAAEMKAPAVQTAAARYVDAVIDQDWPSQAKVGEVSAAGWMALRALQTTVLAIAPTDLRTTRIADQMTQELWTIQRQRQLRGFESAGHVPFEFWFAAIAGLAMIGSLMFIYAPTPKHLMVVGTYSIYAGIVLYMIFDLSRPFGGLVTVGPDAFEQARGSFHSGL
jgi:hypothetical protein